MDHLSAASNNLSTYRSWMAPLSYSRRLIKSICFHTDLVIQDVRQDTLNNAS
jgi:hypothetical protein